MLTPRFVPLEDFAWVSCSRGGSFHSLATFNTAGSCKRTLVQCP